MNLNNGNQIIKCDSITQGEYILKHDLIKWLEEQKNKLPSIHQDIIGRLIDNI